MALINKLSAIGEAIREKTGKEDLLTLDEMPVEIRGIETGGGGIDLISYGTNFTFDVSVSEITEEIVLHCEKFSSIGNMFDLKEVNAPKVTVYISEKCASVVRFLRIGGITNEGLKELEIIGDTKNVTNFQQFVMNRSSLERIIGELDFSSATIIQYAFSGCSGLREITPKPNTIKVSLIFGNSSNLTEETIQAIINGLADLTGSTAQTLTLHKDVKAKLTQDQIAQITNKNWTLA